MVSCLINKLVLYQNVFGLKMISLLKRQKISIWNNRHKRKITSCVKDLRRWRSVSTVFVACKDTLSPRFLTNCLHVTSNFFLSYKLFCFSFTNSCSLLVPTKMLPLNKSCGQASLGMNLSLKLINLYCQIIFLYSDTFGLFF